MQRLHIWCAHEEGWDLLVSSCWVPRHGAAGNVLAGFDSCTEAAGCDQGQSPGLPLLSLVPLCCPFLQAGAQLAGEGCWAQAPPSCCWEGPRVSPSPGDANANYRMSQSISCWFSPGCWPRRCGVGAAGPVVPPPWVARGLKPGFRQAARRATMRVQLIQVVTVPVLAGL